jgi:hypothetical protein
MRHLLVLLCCLAPITQTHAQSPADSSANAPGSHSPIRGAGNKSSQTFDELKKELERQPKQAPNMAADKRFVTDPCVVNPKLPQCDLLK